MDFILFLMSKQVDKACLHNQDKQKLHVLEAEHCKYLRDKDLLFCLQIFKEISKKVPIISPRKQIWTQLRMFTYSCLGFQGLFMFLLKLKSVGTAFVS